MATPTASSSNPSKAANAALHNATTPQSQPHLAAFSPAPRSVPSPAAQRNPAGKSPFNASTHAPSSSTIAAHNHPTGGSSGSATKGLLGSSPAAAMLNLESPIPMQLSLSNMGGLDGGIGMGISMSGISQLGMGLSMTGRASDEERRKRLEEVVSQVKQRPGRVSPGGLEALAKRFGFDADVFPNRREGTFMCVLAGMYIMIEVGFDAHHRVNTVQVSFPTSSEAVNDGAALASKILKDSLSVPSGLSAMTITLDKFAKNLDKLAQLDKPNGPTSEQTFNCFEAVAGVYAGLRRLFDHEKRVVMSLLEPGDDLEERAELEVACKKSGRPMMNAHNEIGLSLDYWVQRRHVRQKYRRYQTPTDPLANSTSRDNGSPNTTESQVFSLSIQCEGSVPELYPPARISDAWISEGVEKPPDDPASTFGSVLDWLDPPPTYQSNPSDGQSNGMVVDESVGKLPNTRFIAKLRPPLVLPWQAAISVLGSVGVPQENILTQFGQVYYDALLLQPNLQAAVAASDPSNMHKREMRSTRTLFVPGDQGTERLCNHANSLFSPKSVPGGILQEIPFDHPKQLVQIIPLLRQYAFLNTLLKDSFSSDNPPSLQIRGNHPPNATFSVPVDMKLSASPPVPTLVTIFPQGRAHPPNLPGAPVNSSSLTTTLDDLLFEVVHDDGKMPDGDTKGNDAPPISITISIHSNADLSIDGSNLPRMDGDVERALAPLDSGGATGQGEERVDGNSSVVRRLSRALDICGDIGIWVEWIRRKTQAMATDS